MIKRTGMSRNLPSTPADVVDASPAFRLKMKAVLRLARVFKFWEHPYKNAATSYEEMSTLDKIYWFHKNTNPITRREKGERAADLLVTDSRVAGLPQGFEKHSSLTVGAAGDLFYADCLEHSKDVLYENVADLLFDQDISYANFECPLTGKAPEQAAPIDKEAPLTSCTRAQFDILKGYKDRRFTVLNTANNHMLDMGVYGIETTLKAFSDEGILDTGTNRKPDEFGQGKILVSEGIKLGFVSATFGLNGHEMPAREAYRINVSKLTSKYVEPDLDLLKRQIDHCKSQECDFIIASLHWGHEYEFFPRQQQVKAAHALIEWGADAIIGHHSHVIQPVEYYRSRRDPQRIAVIAYSLGSLAWTFAAPHIVLSTILNLTLTKGSLQGRNLTYIEKARATPVFRNYTSSGDKILTRIEKLAGHLDGRGGSARQDHIANIKRYADLVLGAYDLPDEKLKDAAGPPKLAA
jgi:poly-gamma-glutamate capsule biosynthesis protein CapA/YwtB (metallophosphatase superfamily)